uniref:Uncharacterized protein TCIL3000_10_11190 n=1 Tax=Trypanosoma congolense (strain IL3000) TaxID=1068625 RepID=G0UY73_TRYCI|nr:unnamed protein product [Trypanosoma congolense IL3000]
MVGVPNIMTSTVVTVFAPLLLAALHLSSKKDIDATGNNDKHVVAQVVFVSCNKHNRDQNYWNTMATVVEQRNESSRVGPMGSCAPPSRVDALIWLGDAVYADNPIPLIPPAELDLDAARDKFMQQANAAQYVAFRHTCVGKRSTLANASDDGKLEGEQHRIVGVWDDHDMGKNDGGGEFAQKDAMQQFYLDFLGVPRNDSRRKQKGVYHFEAVPFSSLTSRESTDPATAAALRFMEGVYDNAFCIVLLDSRYFRDPPNATRSGNMLGDPQFEWLERLLQNDLVGRNPETNREKCALTVVGNGVQIILDEKITENWAAFPNSRNRLFSLLRRYSADRVILMSGDIHMGEIGMDTSGSAMEALGYPIIEATSSGLTHSTSVIIPYTTLLTSLFPSKRRVGAYVERNFGILKLTVKPGANFTLQASATPEEKQSYVEKNVNASIVIHSIAEEGKVVLRLSVPLDALTLKMGCQFYQARANEAGEVAYSDTATQKVCNETFQEASGAHNGTSPVRHYPITTPLPFTTYTMLTLQERIWPNYSLLGVFFRFVLVVALVVIAGVISVIVICCRACRRRQKES